MTDQELLAQYATSRSESAFAELVSRHKDWIYSVCLRGTGDQALADDATQNVLICLARKAGTLRHYQSLTAWLYRAARYSAANARKIQHRRIIREVEVAQMSSHRAVESDASIWTEIAPNLEPALDSLPARHRVPILLRFYQQQSHAEIARTLEISEGAAQKRVERAVARLRELLARRGVTLPAATFAALLGSHAVRPTPASLAATLSGLTRVIPPPTPAIWGFSLGPIFKFLATAASLLLAVYASITFVHAQSPIPANPSPLQPASPARPTTAPASAGLTAQLNSDVTVEFIGMSTIPPTAHSWWGPDGKQLAEAPAQSPPVAKASTMPATTAQTSGGGMIAFQGNLPRSVQQRIRPFAGNVPDRRMWAIRITQQQPVDAANPVQLNFSIQAEALGGRSSTGSTTLNAPRGSTVMIGMFVPPHGARSATVDFQLPSGPWSVAFSAPIDIGATGGIGGSDVSITPGVEKVSKTQTTMTITGEPLGLHRFVAVDTAGNARVPSMSQGTSGMGSNMTFKMSFKYEFDLPLTRIDHFEVQTRNFGPPIEFRNLCLDPSRPTHPIIVMTTDNAGAAK